MQQTLTTAEDASVQSVDAVVLPWVDAEALQEAALGAVALHLVDQDGSGVVCQPKEVEGGGDGHVGLVVAQETADRQGVVAVPVVPADGAPVPVEADLHLTFVLHVCTRQTHIAIVAD